MKLRTIFILLFLFFFLKTLSIYGQNEASGETPIYIITGKVYDSSNGDTLIGVTLSLKDTYRGTTSGINGIFKLSLPKGKYTLVFSYVGYEKKEVEILVNSNREIAVSLSPEYKSIDEVKITGQRKFFGNMEYGRDIPSINAKQIEKLNTSNASDILHARVAGVWATKTSGSPGDHEKIRIRGQNSFFSSAEPLYVVDGVPVPIVNMSSLGIADLNINDIENVTVLRDASSTALYGFQGGNGVVLIDTKKGGENEINFSTKFGFQWFDNFYDLMNTRDFLASLDSAKSILRITLADNYPKITDNPSDDNWQKEIFQHGSSNEYQLSASGTAKKIKYYFSTNYTSQKGILSDETYRKYTFSSRFSKVFRKKLVIEAGYRGSLQENKNNQDIYKGNPLLFEGITKSPCLRNTPDTLIYFYDPVQNSFGEPVIRIYYNYPQLNNPVLPQWIKMNNNHNLRISSHIINGSARLQINDHLSLNAMESFMLRNSNYFYEYHNFDVYGTIKSNEDVLLFNHQYNISYFNTYGKHDIGLVAAYRYYMDNLWWKVDSVRGIMKNYSYLRNSMAAYGPKGSVVRSLSSYVFNASYSYRYTYFVSAVANISKVKEGLHIDYFYLFPSIACSWDIAQEQPLKKISWLNNFNLYFNWGKSGNYPLNGLGNDLYHKIQYTYGTTTGTYPEVLQLANHYLKHESTEEFDYGIKSSFLNHRISISAVAYIKDISNLIMLRQIPNYYAGGMQYVNVGKLHVTGNEFGIEADPINTRNFSWNLKFNFSTSKQVVKKLLGKRPLDFIDNEDILMPEFIIKEGEPLGNIIGYKALGKWTTADDLSKNKHYYKMGNMKFYKPDTISASLNPRDKVVIGNSIPDFTWNFSNSFQYKSFSLDMVWYAVWGVQKFNETRAATVMTGTNSEINRYISDTMTVMLHSPFYQSSEFIDDASFIRLKNITLTYEPKRDLIEHIKFRFSLSIENVITITKYKGYDPEATTFTDNNFSDNALDRGSVPNPKAVYVTVSIKY